MATAQDPVGASSSSQTSHVQTKQQQSQPKTLVGNSHNFWLFSSQTGFDLTRPPLPTPSQSTITITTSTTPITISPPKTALIIIDMQNFFLSEAMGRKRGAGHAACEKLIKYAVPAARRAGVQVVWLNWGLSEKEVQEMPAGVKKAFGFQVVDDTGREVLDHGKDERIYKGLGAECGSVTLPSGETIDAGRLLMRDAWNSGLYPPLDSIYKEGIQNANPPDVWIHKNRMSGMWGGTTACQEFLEEKGISTLLFAGVNTDQCVSGTLTDAFSKGYDCVLLSDGCGTTSPDFSQRCIEFNAAKTWGFATTCEEFAKGVEKMDT